MKQLDEQDASYLYLETPETPMHVGGLSLVQLPEGYTGDYYEDYKAHIASRLHLTPMLTRKLLELPYDIAHPVWINDDNVDLDYHIRQVTLPRPGTRRQLEERVARLHSNFLDRSRPLWEFYVIDGLEDGQIGVYTKVHHAAMDGAASQALVTALHDLSAVPRQYPVLADAKPSKESTAPLNVIGTVLKHFLQQEIRTAQLLPELLKTWASIALPNAETLKYPGAVSPPPRAPRTVFNVDITSQRAYAARSLPLADVKAIAKAANVKINDVVMALSSAVLRRYLQKRDGLPLSTMTAMVPVSLRESGDNEMNNQNSMMLCSLGTNLADPKDRLMAIATSAAEQKKLIKTVKNLLVPEISFIGSGIILRGMIDIYRRTKLAERIPPLANLTVSNVQGPPVPLYLAGARVTTFYPVSIPAHASALNITVQSYCQALDIGLTACRSTVPDVVEMADDFSVALEELKSAYGVTTAKEKPAAALPAAATPAAATPPAAAIDHAAEATAPVAAKATPKTTRKPAVKAAAKPAAKPAKPALKVVKTTLAPARRSSTTKKTPSARKAAAH